jgi:RNA polymerase sigma-54 factor
MARKPGLNNELRTVIKPIVTPAQIQALKLIVIPTAGFMTRIEQELEDNPALEMLDEIDELTGYATEKEAQTEDYSEAISDMDPSTSKDSDSEYEGDEFSASDDGFDSEETSPFDGEDYEAGSFEQEYMKQYMEDDPYGYAESGGSYNQDEEDRTVPVVVEKSYHEYLCEQVDLLDFENETEALIADLIIGNIDNHGYLSREVEGIVKDLRVYHDVVVEKREVTQMLYRIQRFDPPGTGARDLRDCLLIQLRLLLEANGLRPSDRAALSNAYIIIDEYFEEFKKKHYTRLQRALSLKKESDLEPYINLIRKLNPKPASGFASTESISGNYIMPDFIIYNEDDGLVLTLNARNAPELRVNDSYQEQLRSFKEKKSNKTVQASDVEAMTFIKSKIDSARWFIDAIKQRQDTMLRTMDAIMKHQYEFFKTGDARKMRPMILKDISEVTMLDISTVSRVANSKFVQTEFGTKRIKDFFSESLQNDEGEEVSTLEVKEILKEIISKESQAKPLSDEKIRSMLMRKGYNIARRTVAKYRESLNIPVARMRKELVRS